MIGAAALDVGPGAGALDAYHPVGGELLVAADLTAAPESAGIDADHFSGRREVDAGRIFHVLAAPGATDLPAEVAAGSGENRYRRLHAAVREKSAESMQESRPGDVVARQKPQKRAF